MRSMTGTKLVGSVILIFLVTFIAANVFAEEQSVQTVKITAKKFEYSPNVIRLKKGIPAVLEFTSLDRLHGFSCEDLNIRTDINPGKVSTVRFVPDKAGTFEFHCDIFCGEGHGDMTGKIIVEE